MRKFLLIIGSLLLLINLPLYGQESLRVVVTSTWTAGYALLAGINDFDMLAPSDMQHPSEYELQVDDIIKLKNADLVICGGYETMMEKIRKGLQIGDDKILQIQTDYNLEHIKASVRAIAEMAGTGENAEKNLIEIGTLFEESRQKIKEAGIVGVPVLVQFFMRPFAVELGLTISGIFGPRQLEAFDIQKLMKLDFGLILDNAHNPSAQPLLETKKNIPIAYLINFPGNGGTRTIGDVISYNTDMIIKAYTASR